MSARFIAHVERPDGRVHHIDCDAAHENDAGRLALTVNTYIGAIAAYAPGEWISYYLEAAPEPVTREQVERGEKSVNDYRRYHGMQPFPNDVFIHAIVPRNGDKIHISANGICLTGVCDQNIPVAESGSALGIQAKLDRPLPNGSTHWVAYIYDEARQEHGSWHWPHDDEQPVEQDPDAPVPVTVNVHVEGSILTDEDLRRVIDQQIVKHIQRTMPRRPTQY